MKNKVLLTFSVLTLCLFGCSHDYYYFRGITKSKKDAASEYVLSIKTAADLYIKNDNKLVIKIMDSISSKHIVDNDTIFFIESISPNPYSYRARVIIGDSCWGINSSGDSWPENMSTNSMLILKMLKKWKIDAVRQNENWKSQRYIDSENRFTMATRIIRKDGLAVSTESIMFRILNFEDPQSVMIYD